MAVIALTFEEYKQVVKRLINLSQKASLIKYHSAGPEYTSLMVCFLLHNIISAKSLLQLSNSFGQNGFPATVGYSIVRPMFEVDVTAHYISQSPIDRSQQYIQYEKILKKKEMDAFLRHTHSKKPGWQEPLKIAWKEFWEDRESEINKQYLEVKQSFNKVSKKGIEMPFQNWSGKSIHQMAIEVDHEEAYDIFYAELSSYTHVDVRLANRFLHINPDGLSWSTRPSQYDKANVFRHAATFLNCYMELFTSQFKVWSKEQIETCWFFGKP